MTQTHLPLCPRCQNDSLQPGPKAISCQTADCGFTLWKSVSNRELTTEQISELLAGKTTAAISGFTSKAGKSFTARLKLSEEFKTVFVFDDAPAAGLGELDGSPLTVGASKLGTYVRYDGQFYTIAGKTPAQVTREDALAAINAKKTGGTDGRAASNRVAQVGTRYQILNGKFGLYVSDGQTNASLKKSVTPEAAKGWTAQECQAEIDRYLTWKATQKS